MKSPCRGCENETKDKDKCVRACSLLKKWQQDLDPGLIRYTSSTDFDSLLIIEDGVNILDGTHRKRPRPPSP